MNKIVYVIYIGLIIFHNICTVLILCGPFLLPKKYIKYWFVLLGSSFLQWWLLEKCLITKVEQKLFKKKLTITEEFLQFLDKIGQAHNKDCIVFLLDVQIFLAMLFAFFKIGFEKEGIIIISMVMAINYAKNKKITFEFDGKIN